MSDRMSVDWYELLGVAPDASADEIRLAWKSAVTGLDPTDRTFRIFNQAGEVLLDPARRAAFDADRAEMVADEPEASPEEPWGTAPPVMVPEAVEPGEPASASASAQRRGVPGWLLVGVAVLTAVAVGACAWLWFERPADSTVDASTRAAQSAAERAIGPILSYDASSLDEDQQAASSYMTSQYRTEYDKLFEVIKQNAPATETVVTAQVVASGVVRSGQDRVDVLLFVNRPTTNKQNAEPVVYKDQVTVTMEQVGGEWLVDDLVTSPVGQ